MSGSLNEIALDAALLSQLYGKSLVEVEPRPTRLPAREKSLRYLGNNEAHVAIIIDDPKQTYLPEEELALLTKMLGACRLTMADVAIVNLANGVQKGEIIAQLSPLKLIIFGESDKPFIEESANPPELRAPALADLLAETESSKALKSKLWGCLKKMFLLP